MFHLKNKEYNGTLKYWEFIKLPVRFFRKKEDI